MFVMHDGTNAIRMFQYTGVHATQVVVHLVGN